MWNDRHLRGAAMGLALLLLPVSGVAQVGPNAPMGGPEVMRPLTVQAVTEADLIASLEQEGFSVVERERTFLGRVRILAVGPAGTREVILNPRNGRVLRDLIRRRETAPPDSPPAAPPEQPPESPPESPPGLPEEASAAEAPGNAAEILLEPAPPDSAANGASRDGVTSRNRENRDGGGRDGGGRAGGVRSDRGR